jgi:MinD superfamily P-loop ATPase
MDMAHQVFLKVDFERCRVCKRCLAAQACKLRAIMKIDPDEPPFIESSRCRDCRVCVPTCPFRAIVVEGGYQLTKA